MKIYSWADHKLLFKYIKQFKDHKDVVNNIDRVYQNPNQTNKFNIFGCQLDVYDLLKGKQNNIVYLIF